ncbi:MAG: CpsD/CapB family tyrosine-protein kinase [Pseudomonadales bacterium]|nr:CpsD/CapB family tyrosine-protein kinase [Pseudomonadales bacterium]
MDHISKALEKATSERKSVRGWVQPNQEADNTNIGSLTGREVELDHDLLQAHHILSTSDNEDATVADRYRLLRTRTLQLMKPRGWNTLGITSAGPKAGKSLTALNLAITMARSSDQKIVLVDADLRKPSIAQDLGLDVDKGIIDFLSTDIPLSDILIHPKELPNLTILPGRSAPNSAVTPELLSSAKMNNLVETFSAGKTPNLVIVDLPPALIGDDVIAQASHLQCLLLIVEQGVTTVDELIDCAELLKELNILGTVLNKSTERPRQFEGYYQISAGQPG